LSGVRPEHQHLDPAPQLVLAPGCDPPDLGQRVPLGHAFAVSAGQRRWAAAAATRQRCVPVPSTRRNTRVPGQVQGDAGAPRGTR
jgi:hypothetical protein